MKTIVLKNGNTFRLADKSFELSVLYNTLIQSRKDKYIKKECPTEYASITDTTSKPRVTFFIDVMEVIAIY